MKVAGTFTFDAPLDVVWEGLQDPEVLAATLPGCEKLERVGENEYEGLLNIKVGPVQGKFQGKVGLTQIDPPNGYTMQVDGRGAPGFVKASAEIRLTAAGDKTALGYDGDAQIGGRIASVGQRLLDSSAKAIIQQSLEGLDGVLRTRAGGAAEGTAAGAAEGRAPVGQASQAAFAAKVAKEVAKDLLPPQARVAILVAAGLLLLVVLYLLLS